MFVLLEHVVGVAVHWDFLVEIPGSEKLASWRLLQSPFDAAAPVIAEPMADHRRLYLEFEGELTGGRGCVRRLDRGDAEVVAAGPGTWIFRLAGARLSGLFKIAAGPATTFGRSTDEAAV